MAGEGLGGFGGGDLNICVEDEFEAFERRIKARSGVNKAGVEGPVNYKGTTNSF